MASRTSSASMPPTSPRMVSPVMVREADSTATTRRLMASLMGRARRSVAADSVGLGGAVRVPNSE